MGLEDVNIFDIDGAKKDFSWLLSRFGQVSVARSDDANAHRLVELHEAQAGHVLRVQASSDVAIFWPDAPSAPEAGGLGKAVRVPIKPEDGHAHFTMGDGAWYTPPARGPHAAWVWGQPSDIVEGLGMVRFTQYLTLRPVFSIGVPPPPPPPPPGECEPIGGWDRLFKRMDRIILALGGET